MRVHMDAIARWRPTYVHTRICIRISSACSVADMAHVDRESWRRRLSGLGWSKRVRLARTPKWCFYIEHIL